MGREWVSGDASDYHRHQRKMSCESKRRFSNRAEAKNVRRAMRESKLAIYGPCKYCRGYHIGHHDGSDKILTIKSKQDEGVKQYGRKDRQGARASLRYALDANTSRQ